MTATKGTYSDDMQTVKQLIHNMDFKLLKAQKRILNLMQDKTEDEAEKATIEGILGLIDFIQDKAVDVYGYSEDVVFSLSESEGWISDEQARAIIMDDVVDEETKIGYDLENEDKEVVAGIEGNPTKGEIREYNEEMHEGTTLEGEDLYTIDESEVEDFGKWLKIKRLKK